MDREQFWALIAATKATTDGDCTQQTAHLIATLRQRSVSDVLDYDRIHDELMAESYGGPMSFAAFEPTRHAMGDTLRFAARMNLIEMEPRGDLSSTGYARARSTSYSTRAISAVRSR
jgi:hypothetical protein